MLKMSGAEVVVSTTTTQEDAVRDKISFFANLTICSTISEPLIWTNDGGEFLWEKQLRH